MDKKYFLICCLTCMALLTNAKITLPGIFNNNMVLQQQSNVAIWGNSKANKSITIIPSWDKKSYIGKTDKNGLFKLSIHTPKAGGPYNISISDGEKLTLSNVLIGEVWVCSGQSNMEMPLRGNSSPILNASEIILNANNPKLRLFEVARASTINPIADLKGSWKIADSESAREYSALAFQYGQILQKKLQVPVGIILSTVGGTMIEAWMSAKSLSDFPEVKIPQSLAGNVAPHKEATALFNGMIAPITGYGIKGFVWFQGESNRHEPELYEKLFPAMVADWRQRWGLGNLPFYYVQIAPLAITDKTRSGLRIREVQLKLMDVIPNCGMIPSIDVGMEKDIHFMDKTKLAQRVSYWALGQTYGIKGINYKFPTFKSLAIEGNKATVTFNNAPYLTSYKKPLSTFEIAGDDKIFHPANAEIKANQVILQSDSVSKPVAVRYAYKEWVVGELFNNEGLPASSFRTDNW